MGKKSKRSRPLPGGSRRETIKARQENHKPKETTVEFGENPRKDADTLKKTFLYTCKDKSKKWDRTRIMLLRNYEQIVAKCVEARGAKFVTEDDKHFIKNVIQDTNELCFFRTILSNLMAIISFHDCEIEAAGQHLELTLQISKQATKREKKFILSDNDDEKEITGGVVLQDTMKKALQMLPHFQNTPEVPITVWEEHQKDNAVLIKDGGTFVGGEMCSACGKTLEDLGIESTLMMDCCQTCQLTYYCSPECQGKDWPNHKKVCRKPGEFEAGDLVRIASKKCPLPYQSVARVWMPCEEDTSHWVVMGEDVDSVACVVPASMLRRVRPGLWYPLKNKWQMESESLGKELKLTLESGTVPPPRRQLALLSEIVELAKRQSKCNTLETMYLEARRRIQVTEQAADLLKHTSHHEAAKMVESQEYKQAKAIIGHTMMYLEAYAKKKDDEEIVVNEGVAVEVVEINSDEGDPTEDTTTEGLGQFDDAIEDTTTKGLEEVSEAIESMEIVGSSMNDLD